MKLINAKREQVVINLTNQEITVDDCKVYNGHPKDANASQSRRRRTQFNCDGLVIERTFEGFNKFAIYLSDMNTRHDLVIHEVYHIVDNELVAITEEIIDMLEELDSSHIECLDCSLGRNSSKARHSRRTFGMNDGPRGSETSRRR